MNNNGDHCEKMEGDRQNSATCSVKYSRTGLKINGAELSVAAITVWGAYLQCSSLTTVGL